MLIIGIDPGISGAICFFQNGEITDVIDMPSMADGKKNKDKLTVSKFSTKFQKELLISPKKK